MATGVVKTKNGGTHLLPDCRSSQDNAAETDQHCCALLILVAAPVAVMSGFRRPITATVGHNQGAEHSYAGQGQGRHLNNNHVRSTAEWAGTRLACGILTLVRRILSLGCLALSEPLKKREAIISRRTASEEESGIL